jgi:hypothetical protein
MPQKETSRGIGNGKSALLTIVGVVADLKHSRLDQAAELR